MNKIKNIILLLFIGFTSVLRAQNAEQIINKHFQNTGGYKAWENLKSVYIEGKVYFNIATPLKIKIEHQRPYYKRVSFIINGIEKLSEGYDGKNAFTYNELNGKNQRLKDYQPDAFETDILNYKKKGFKAKYIGKENIKGFLAYKVELYKNKEKEYYWFGVKDYHLLQMRDNVETVYYSDFKTFKGFTFATKMEYQPADSKDYTVIFNKVVPNKKINPKRFKFE